jgi:hypothetical protein
LFSQITRTTPLRRTILHLGHIFFVDALTFMETVSPLQDRRIVAGGAVTWIGTRFAPG